MARPINRKTQISIRLEPSILEGLRELSERLGVASTTLAAIAIGEYVAKGQASYSNAEEMSRTMAKEMVQLIGGPFADAIEKDASNLIKDLDDD